MTAISHTVNMPTMANFERDFPHLVENEHGRPLHSAFCMTWNTQEYETWDVELGIPCPLAQKNTNPSDKEPIDKLESGHDGNFFWKVVGIHDDTFFGDKANEIVEDFEKEWLENDQVRKAYQEEKDREREEYEINGWEWPGK